MYVYGVNKKLGTLFTIFFHVYFSMEGATTAFYDLLSLYNAGLHTVLYDDNKIEP